MISYMGRAPSEKAGPLNCTYVCAAFVVCARCDLQLQFQDMEGKARGSVVQGQLWLQSKTEASLRYMRPCLKTNKSNNHGFLIPWARARAVLKSIHERKQKTEKKVTCFSPVDFIIGYVVLCGV